MSSRGLGMAYTYLEMAKEVLQDSDVLLSRQQIWDIAREKGLDKKLSSVGVAPLATLSSQLYMSVKKDDSDFITHFESPKLFGLKDKHNNEKCIFGKERKTSKEKSSFKERNLHALFVKFVSESEMFEGIYCKTIFHENSIKNKKGMGKWTNPDIVGVSFPHHYHKGTLELMATINIPRAKIYSFELKKQLGWDNLKEAYFQAVSNSSWANEGYLVVFGKISDSELIAEISQLNVSFGIGVIEFGTNISEFNILFRSKERALELSVLDKLIKNNQHFESFIDNISKDVLQEKNRIATHLYDEILDDKALEKHLIDNKIKNA